MEIYCDDAQSWVQLGGEMQRFPKMYHAEDEATPGYGLERDRNQRWIYANCSAFYGAMLLPMPGREDGARAGEPDVR